MIPLYGQGIDFPVRFIYVVSKLNLTIFISKKQIDKIESKEGGRIWTNEPIRKIRRLPG